VNNVDNQFEWMKNMIFENCFAIGECGLDSLLKLIRKFRKKFFKTDKVCK
jgi:TatD DNase family protein